MILTIVVSNPKHIMIEGVWYRNNYGVVYSKPFWPPEIPLNRGERKNYYCYLSEYVQFINRYRIWRSDVIFYNDEIGGWFVYDSENKQYTGFEELLPVRMRDINLTAFYKCPSLSTIYVPAKTTDYYKELLPEKLYDKIVEIEPEK